MNKRDSERVYKVKSANKINTNRSNIKIDYKDNLSILTNLYQYYSKDFLKGYIHCLYAQGLISAEQKFMLNEKLLNWY